MLHYIDCTDVRVGDLALHHGVQAVVETLIEGGDVAKWGVDAPGFMIVCEECGRVFVVPGSDDWEDVAFVAHTA